MYKLLRPLLFRLDPETSHHLTLTGLRALYRIPGARALFRAAYAQRVPSLPVRLMGLDFPNPVGLAAGLDKNAACLAPLADMGFGWLELGTVTPRPQPGNPRPRLFRLPREEAIINRMGFNNVGVAAFLHNLRRQSRPGILGINIGKNRDTPIEQAVEDYLAGLRAVAPVADYVTVNVSSPNTAQLRELQGKDQLAGLLSALKAEQARIAQETGRYVPIALKIAPDLSDMEIRNIAQLLLTYRFDAVIATNTTVGRPGLPDGPVAAEAGGLSGRPLKTLSTAVVGKLYAQLRGEIPIIGVGGISSAEDAWEKLAAGADLVQVYSSLIYHGPGVVREIVTGLGAHVASGNLAQALATARTNLSSRMASVGENGRAESE